MAERFHLGSSLVALAVGLGAAMLWFAASERFRPRVVGLAVLGGAAVAGFAGAPRPLLGVALAIVGVVVAADDRPEVAGPAMRVVGFVSLVGVWLAVPDTEAALAIGIATAPVLLAESITGEPFRRGERWVLLLAVAAAVASGATGTAAWAGGLACAGVLVSRAPVGPIGVAVHVVAVAAASRLVTRLEPVPAVIAAVGILVGAAVYEALLNAAAPARRTR